MIPQYHRLVLVATGRLSCCVLSRIASLLVLFVIPTAVLCAPIAPVEVEVCAEDFEHCEECVITEGRRLRHSRILPGRARQKHVASASSARQVCSVRVRGHRLLADQLAPQRC